MTLILAHEIQLIIHISTVSRATELKFQPISAFQPILAFWLISAFRPIPAFWPILAFRPISAYCSLFQPFGLFQPLLILKNNRISHISATKIMLNEIIGRMPEESISHAQVYVSCYYLFYIFLLHIHLILHSDRLNQYGMGSTYIHSSLQYTVHHVRTVEYMLYMNKWYGIHAGIM